MLANSLVSPYFIYFSGDLCDLVDHCGGMTVLQEDLFSFDPGFKQVIVMEVRDDLDLDDLRSKFEIT